MKVISSAQGAYLKVGGKKYLNLCSNNYLGLAADPVLEKAAIEGIKKYGVGTASVRALVGTNDLHVELEKKLAKFKKAEDAVVFTGGYLANMAAIQTVLTKEDWVVSDELNHASIIDAIRLAQIQNKKIFKHGDMADLRSKLGEIPRQARDDHQKILVVTDGVFSMDGDVANLPEIVKIAREFDAMVMVDDAHGEGVLGDHGRGIVDHFKLHGQVDIDVGTLSKAFGVMGGFVSGSRQLCDLLRAKARQFLFTNALSIPDTAALIAAVDLLEKSDGRVKKLWENTRFLKDSLAKAGFDLGKSTTPITPVMVGDEDLAAKFSDELFSGGVLASVIKFPMVAMGAARLRLMPSAIHSRTDLEKGITVLVKVGKALEII